jgi:hypothetical protein
MFHDPSEPYREARRAVEAQALAQNAEAKARAAMANARTDVVTCSGCKAADQSGDWGQGNCREYREAGLCQRQIYVRITMARLLVDLVRSLAEMDANEALMQEMVRQFQTSLGVGYDEVLVQANVARLEGPPPS